MKKKAKPLSYYKKRAWKALSLYVRKGAADVNDNVSCVTCGEIKHYKKMQAGHFLPKMLNTELYFDPMNVHVQCYRCNINLGGFGASYYLYMKNIYGEEEIKKLFAKIGSKRKYKKEDYIDMESKFLNKKV